MCPDRLVRVYPPRPILALSSSVGPVSHGSLDGSVSLDPKPTIPCVGICYDTVRTALALLSDSVRLFRKRHFPERGDSEHSVGQNPLSQSNCSTPLASGPAELFSSALLTSESRRDSLPSDSAVSANNSPG